MHHFASFGSTSCIVNLFLIEAALYIGFSGGPVVVGCAVPEPGWLGPPVDQDGRMRTRVEADGRQNHAEFRLRCSAYKQKSQGSELPQSGKAALHLLGNSGNLHPNRSLLHGFLRVSFSNGECGCLVRVQGCVCLKRGVWICACV